MKIDNFALTMFQTCPHKYFRRMIQGWTPRRKSGALGFGGALHEGLAEWHRDGELGMALVAIDKGWPDAMPVDDFRTKDKCLSTMMEYVKQYPTESFKTVVGPNGPLIEVPFTLDTGMYLPCRLSWIGTDKSTPDCSGVSNESGVCVHCGKDCEPIEYGGIFDGLVEYGGTVYVLEHKSTSMLGSTYFNQFKPNNQVTGYVWAAGQMSGRQVGGAIINAIGVYRVGKTKFERHITNRFPEEIVEWLENVRIVCNQIKEAELRQTFSRSTGACTMYGLCEFHSVCNLAREKERLKRLDMDYHIDPWDYEKRGGTEVPNANS